MHLLGGCRRPGEGHDPNFSSLLTKFCRQSDTLAAGTGILLAGVSAGLMLSVARPTAVVSFGYPPWGNHSMGRVQCDATACNATRGLGCDAAVCVRRESARFDEFLDKSKQTYNWTAILAKLEEEKSSLSSNFNQMAADADWEPNYSG
jgi:hypothetical protein